MRGRWIYLALVLAASRLMAGVWEELSAAQRMDLEAGKQVVLTRDIAGKPWPEVTVYQKSASSAEELAAVFFDYSSAKQFIPNVLKSDVALVRSPTEMEVDYILDVPILPDEHYTARNTLEALEGGGFLVKWKLLRARQTKDSMGEFRVEPLGGGALIRYRALTTPSSDMAGLLRGKAIEQMRCTVEAIACEPRRLGASCPAELQSRVEKLRQALGRPTP